MKKVILLLGTLLFITSANAEYLRGDFNSWDTSFEFVDSDLFLAYSFQYSGSSGAVAFKVDETGDWSNQWGGNVEASPNVLKGKLTNGWGDASIQMVDTKYYTFKLNGESNWTDRDLIVFETDATPANIVSVTDDSLTATTSLTVTIVTDANVTQDSVYVRYAINSEWGSTIVLKATKTADMTYQAVISGLSPSDVVTYYVMTSSFPQATLESAPDVYFLNRETNGGENFTYTAPVATTLKQTNAIDFNVTSYNNHLSVDVNSDMMQQASMTLINLAGQASAEYNTQLMTGSNTIDLPYQLSRGIYVLQIKVGTDQYVQKIAIQ